MSNNMNRPPQGPPAGMPRRGPGGPPHMRIAEKPKDFKGSLKRLIGYLKPYGLKIFIVTVAAILSILFSIFSPLFLGRATNSIADSLSRNLPIDFPHLFRLLALTGTFYLLNAAFSYLQSYIMADVAQSFVYNLRCEVDEKLERVGLWFFDTNSHGDILSRVINDLDTVSMSIQMFLSQIITSAITLVGVLAIMLTLSPILTITVLITVPLTTYLTRFVAKRSQKLFKGQQKSLGELNGHIEEMYAGHKIVKLFSHEEKAIEDFCKLNEKLYDVGWKAQFLSGLMMPLTSIINNIGYILVAVVGAFLSVTTGLTLGVIQAFLQYQRQFSQPIGQIANMTNIIQSTIAAAERVFMVLDEKEEEKDPEFPIEPNVVGNVCFSHVKFGYSPDKILIKDLNIDIKSGQMVAIVGPTGAGKTTLVNLLMRFYELDGGKITIDGVDIRHMRRRDLRRIFGMVLQDTWLFSGTIAQNIAYGKEHATMEEIVNAARMASADHFIRTLPEGYNTIIDEEASNISMGEKQLITIARAIMANPAILILDEATSSVDTRTEMLIQSGMKQLMKGRTSFVIAHRLSTIRDADLILVLNDGDIIETGTHEELLEKGGFYKKLYDSQFSA